MAFTTGTATFQNGSATATNVTLNSGSLAFFASGTAVFIQSQNQFVEAVGLPKNAQGEVIDSQFLLRKAWNGAGGSFEFVAFDTIEGLRDAVQAARGFSGQLSTVLNSVDVNPTANSIARRTSNGRIKTSNATDANDAVALGQLPGGVSDLYARNNIIGTVSQSAGVPTGAIIERGSNASGDYIKYADGTLVCCGSMNKSAFVIETPFFATIQGVNIYRSGTPAWTYPHAFVTAPLVVPVPLTGFGSSSPSLFTTSLVKTATSTNIQVKGIDEGFQSGSNDYENLQSVEVFAIGRWY